MEVLSFIMTSLLLPEIFGKLTSNSFSKIKGKGIEQEFKNKIINFNKSFESTELDCNSFQRYFEESDVVDKIYNFLLNLSSVGSFTEDELIENISNEAFMFVNKSKKQIGHPVIIDKSIFIKYFSLLMDMLKEMRYEYLSISEQMQISIHTSGLDTLQKGISRGFGDIVNRLEGSCKSPALNTLLKEKLENIRELIDHHKLTEAENQLETIIISDEKITNQDKEEYYYLRGLILLSRNDNVKLKIILSQLEAINQNSKYINEINYRIACENHDEIMFNKSIEALRNVGIPDTELIRRRAYFELTKGNYENVVSLLCNGETIKEEFSHDDKALFYLGSVFLQRNNYIISAKYFSLAYNVRSLPVYKYNEIVSDILPILQDRRAAINITTEISNILNKALMELEEIKYFFVETELQYKVQYWCYYFNILLILDAAKLISTFDELVDFDIRQDTTIVGIIADACYGIKNYDRALYLLEEIYKCNKAYLIKYIFILRIKNRWSKIQELIEKVPYEEFDDEGIIATFVVEKNIIDGNLQKAKESISYFNEKYLNSVYYIDFLLGIEYKLNDDNLRRLIISKVMEMKNKICKDDKLCLANTLIKIDELSSAKELLRDLCDSEDEALKCYCNILAQEDTVSSIEELEEIFDRRIKNGNPPIFLLNINAMVKLKMNEWGEALEILEKIYKDEKSFFTAFNIVLCKLNLRDFSNIKQYTEYLLGLNYLPGHILVARCFAETEKWILAKEISFEALYKNGENISKEVLINYICLIFNNYHHSKKEEVEYETIIIDSAITLVDNQGKRKVICIHSNNELIEQSGEYKFACENYGYEDYLSLELLGHRKDDRILIDNVEYKIVDIIDIHTYLFRFCLNKLETEYPNHGLYKIVSAETSEKMIDEMTRMMTAHKEERKELLKLYNFSVSTGLPLTYLSDKDLSNYVDIIINILNMKEQRYYAGEISDINGKVYLLSLCSIILLHEFGLLKNILNSREGYVITKSTLEYIKQALQNSLSKGRSIDGTTYIDESGTLRFNEITEEQKDYRTKFWRELLAIIRNVRVIDIKVAENELYKVSKSLFHQIDIDAIEGAKYINGVLVSDDLLIRRLGRSVYYDMETTNIVGVAFNTLGLEYNEKLDLVYKLSACNYVYCCNAEILYELVTVTLSNKIDYGYWIMYSKVGAIINNILQCDVKDYYQDSFSGFLEKVKSHNELLVGLYILLQRPFGLIPYNDIKNEAINKVINKFIG